MSTRWDYPPALLAQNPNDQHAVTLRGKVTNIESQFEKELSKAKELLIETEQEEWESSLKTIK
ncbi:hypothetical protein [Radiobacillus sp. PE A8.2]|uniref:hypothetical protein n=1 Tax=Radiobacillus sp. PE A8.2 TaxID=3380349 RepID=UPI00389096DD